MRHTLASPNVALGSHPYVQPSTDPMFGSLASAHATSATRLFSRSTRRVRNPGTRPHPAGIADEARPRRDDDARLQTSRHHHAVRSSQHPRWHRHRPLHAAPSPPRVHPLPQYDRGAGPCGKRQTSKVRQWLARHSRWTFHFTPTSASWLNAVEGFFAKLTRQRLKRGVFRSVIDLQVAINRFVAETNLNPKPFVWTADPKRVLAAVKRGKQTLESVH